MLEQLLNALLAVFLGVGACTLYYVGSNFLLDQVFADSGENAVRNSRQRAAIRPWLFLAPALLILSIYLVYPVLETLRLSFYNFGGFEFVGLKNYIWATKNPEFLQGHRQQFYVADCCADIKRRFWFGGCRFGRQTLVGNDCQILDFYADGDFICRCKCDLEIRL